LDILDLQNQLDSLTAWRKKELTQAHSLAENAQNDDAKRYLCRVWVLIMYAHCDNFLKESTKLYLTYAKSNLYANCKMELMWLAMRGKENITGGSDSKYKSLNAYSRIDRWDLLDEVLINEILGKGSFKYRYLRFVCDWVLQLEYNHQDISDFCERLKAKLDSIAHGEASYVEEISDCLPWHINTIKFIDTLKDTLN
jgi:hypothetical protein